MSQFQDTLRANTELVVEKMTAPSESPRISRPRLLVLLEKSLTTCTSTVLCGRAGTGKTSLALDFALTCGREVAWYKVDAPEGDLQIFFQYMITSIRNHRSDFGTQALARAVRTVQLDEIPKLAEAFVFELVEGESKPLLIVIEDLHLVGDSEWLVPFFRRLLPLLPSEVHMLITSRSMLPGPLWRMRSKQTLSVIEEEVLAFTRQEAIELFTTYGLSGEQANIALDHAHGRAAGLSGYAVALSSVARRIPKDSYAQTGIS